jgi:plastocyanin
MKTNKTYIPGLMIALLVVIFSLSGYSTKWVVQVANFSFTPSSLPNVVLGDTVRWIYVSGVHTTTSTTIPAGAAPWDAPIDAGNTSYEYIPSVTGTYNYYCMHHPSMIASFTVAGFIPTLTVTPPNRNVTYVVGTTTFTVTSNTSWTAISDQPWCTVTPSGNGNGTITATYVSNPGVNQRIASITVSASGATSQGVTVTQDGAPRTIAVSPPSQNVAKQAGSTDFAVTSNTDWTVSSDSPWCTVTPSGTGNGTITATYTDNSSGPPRVATISVVVTGLPPQVVTVNQDGTTGIAENTAASLVIYPNPTPGAVTVIPGDLKGGSETLNVMDITGRIIYSKEVNAGQQYSLDLSSHPGGYYFVQVISDAGILTKKLILNK